MDDKKLGQMLLRAWKMREGAQVTLMMHFGDKLGLYAAAAKLGTMTPRDLSQATDTNERWMREWLSCMAAADFFESDDGETFTMSPEAVVVLADASNPMFAGGALQAPPPDAHIAGVEHALRTGEGFTYGDMGEGTARSVEAGFAPRERAMLMTDVVPAIPGLNEALTNGARMVDVGCGTGFTLSLLAEAYPDATFTGYDPSEPATDIAMERFDEGGNVTIHCAGGEDLPNEESFDVAFTFDCLHDMPRPDLTLAAIKRSLSSDGVLVIKEIRSSGDFTKDRKNPVHAMMYATSMISCLASACSSPDGLGYGTLGLNPGALEKLCIDAGFSSVTMHDVGDPTNLFYEVRP